MVGGVFGLTFKIMVLLAAAPAELLTLAVMVWRPDPRLAEKLAPIPICPLRLDFQIRLSLRSPSLGSSAEPLKKIGRPRVAVAPFPGPPMKTAKAAEGGLTVTVMEVVEASPAE